MDSCQSLDELCVSFQTKLTSIKRCIQMREIVNEPGVQPILVSIDNSLDDMCIMLSAMKTELHKKKKALEQFQKLQNTTKEICERVAFAEKNLPERLPNRPATGTSTSVLKHTMGPPATPMAKLPYALETPVGGVSTGFGNGDGSNGTPAPSIKQLKKRPPALFVPSIEFLTVAEFESVPKYMRGRLTYQQVNGAIEEFNKALTAKYKILYTPRAKQTDYIRSKIITYKEQENKDVKGMHFIVDNDLKTLSKMKLDQVGRNTLTILRHCGRMKEIRGQGITRYALSL